MGLPETSSHVPATLPAGCGHEPPDAPWALFNAPEDDDPTPNRCHDKGRPIGLFGGHHQGCRRQHPRDASRWCEWCFDALTNDLDVGAEDLAGHDFDAASVALVLASCESYAPDSNPEPVATLDMAGWIEAQAEAIRAHGSDLALWLAAKVASIADDARSLSAETPDQFDDREAIMLRDLAVATSEGGAL